MYHYYDQVSGSVTATGKAPIGNAPVLRTGTGATPTYIPPYTPSTGSIGFNASNKIKSRQDFFKMNGSGLPVFLRGPRDLMVYKGIMVFSLVGIAATLYGVARMATGGLHKKQHH